jgi:hypothetical protein
MIVRDRPSRQSLGNEKSSIYAIFTPIPMQRNGLADRSRRMYQMPLEADLRPWRTVHGAT